MELVVTRPRKTGSVSRPGCAPARPVLYHPVAVADRGTLPNGTRFLMLSSTDRPAVNNLFRPSLLAWRAKHLAEKAAQAGKPENTGEKPPAPVRKPGL